MPDLEDDEELSIQDDAENAEEEIAEEENTSEITELFGDNTENQEVSMTVQKVESLLKQMNNISLI